MQCVEKHHQLSACLFVQRFAAKKQYKDVKAVMISYTFFGNGNFWSMQILFVQIFVCFPFCFAMKPHCVALSGKQVWPENENIYKLSALVDKYCESMHTNLLPFSNKYYMNMQEICVSFEQFWPQEENIYMLSTLGGQCRENMVRAWIQIL